MTVVRNQWMRILLLCLLTGSRVPAAVFDGAVDPANLGKGDWIYVLSSETNRMEGTVPAVTNLQSLMDYEASQGMQWVAVKASSGAAKFPSDENPQFTIEVVLAAHRAGLQIFGYNRSYGLDPQGEVSIADWVYNLGADGLIMDAEAEWESSRLGTAGPALATNILKTIKDRYPTKFMGHSPAMCISWHSSFPYKVFGQYCDAVMPMCYWVDFGVSVGSCVTNWYENSAYRDLEHEWKTWQNGLTEPYKSLSIKPIVPIGQGAAPSSDLTAFVNTLKALPSPASVTGYKGVSWWRAGVYGSASQVAIRNANIGGPFPAKPPAPSTPTGLGATAPGGCFVNLSWTPSANANNYIISRSTTAGGPYTDVDSTLATSYRDSGASGSGIRYYYVVRAANVSGESTASAQASVLTPAPLYPASLTNLLATTVGCQVNLAWSNADNLATYYIVSRAGSPGGPYTAIGLSTSNSYVDLSGAQATTYYYVVRAADNCGLSPANSPEANATTAAGCVADILIDNPNADFYPSVSGWTLGTSSGDKYLADYRFCSTVTGAATKWATYTPDIVTPGYYDVFVWYPVGGNRPTDANHQVFYNGGNVTTNLNQRINGGKWVLIASGKPFLADRSGYVRISNLGGTAGNQVMADGVKFSFSSKNQFVIWPNVTNLIYGQPAPVATATSGLTVNNTVLAGPAWVSNNVVVITNVGAVTVRGDQAGNASWFPAAPATSTFNVGPNSLSIARTSTNNLIVSWPVPAGGWLLERTNMLPASKTAWPQVAPPYQTNSTQAWIVLPPTDNSYYRLRKP